MVPIPKNFQGGNVRGQMERRLSNSGRALKEIKQGILGGYRNGS